MPTLFFRIFSITSVYTSSLMYVTTTNVINLNTFHEKRSFSFCFCKDK